MRTAASDTGFDDFGATLWARLTITPKNLGKFFEIVAFGAVGFDVSSHGGAARVDGFLHDFACGAKQIIGIF